MYSEKEPLGLDERDLFEYLALYHFNQLEEEWIRDTMQHFLPDSRVWTEAMVHKNLVDLTKDRFKTDDIKDARFPCHHTEEQLKAIFEFDQMDTLGNMTEYIENEHKHEHDSTLYNPKRLYWLTQHLNHDTAIFWREEVRNTLLEYYKERKEDNPTWRKYTNEQLVGYVGEGRVPNKWSGRHHGKIGRAVPYRFYLP